MNTLCKFIFLACAGLGFLNFFPTAQANSAVPGAAVEGESLIPGDIAILDKPDAVRILRVDVGSGPGAPGWSPPGLGDWGYDTNYVNNRVNHQPRGSVTEITLGSVNNFAGKTLNTPKTAPAVVGLTRYEVWASLVFDNGVAGWWCCETLTVNSYGEVVGTLSAETLDQRNIRRALVGTIYTVHATENPKMTLTYTGRGGSHDMTSLEATNPLRLVWNGGDGVGGDGALYPYTWWRLIDSTGATASNKTTDDGSKIYTAGVQDDFTRKVFSSERWGANTFMNTITVTIGAQIEGRKWSLTGDGGRLVEAECFDLCLNNDGDNSVIQDGQTGTTIRSDTAQNGSVSATHIDERRIGIYGMGDFTVYAQDRSVETPSLFTVTEIAPQKGNQIQDWEICFTGAKVYPQCLVACVITQKVDNVDSVVFFRIATIGDSTNLFPYNEDLDISKPWVPQAARGDDYPQKSPFISFNLRDVAIQNGKYSIRFYVNVPYLYADMCAAEVGGVKYLSEGTGINPKFGCKQVPMAVAPGIISGLVENAMGAAGGAGGAIANNGTWLLLSDPKMQFDFSVSGSNLTAGSASATPAPKGPGSQNNASTIVTDH